MIFVLVISGVAQEAAKIGKIAVRGNVRVGTQAILLETKTRVGDSFSVDRLTKDTDAIRAMGWFSAVKFNQVLESDNSWSITFEVSEYSLVREISIIGNKAITSAELLPLVTFAPKGGATEEDLRPFNSQLAQPVAREIQELYRKKGFFARVTAVSPDPYNPSTIVIEILETLIGSVTISGFTNTKQRVFERLIKSKPLEPYSKLKWEQDFQRVVNTQWFEDVRPGQITNSDEASGLVNLRMDLNDGQTGLFNAGVVLDPRNSFAGSVSWSQSNFQGTGQTIGLNYQQPTIGLGGSASINYANPFIDSKDTSLQASIYDRVILRFNQGGLGGFGQNNLNLDDLYSERRSGGSLGFTRPNANRSITGVAGRYERINTPQLSNNSNLNFIQQDGEVAAINLSHTLNSRDLDLDPSRGKFIRFDFEPGYSVIRPLNNVGNSPEGRHTFVKFGIDYRAYFTNDKRQRTSQDDSFTVQAFRLRAGTVTGVVPFFEQFFAGGPDSVRGYLQDRFWGKNLLVGTYEYRKPVDGQFSLVAFIDYGSAWGGYEGVNNFTQSQTPSFKLGYGLGVRLRTKIGPIRIEYAFTGDGQTLPIFMIGNNF